MVSLGMDIHELFDRADAHIFGVNFQKFNLVGGNSNSFENG